MTIDFGREVGGVLLLDLDGTVSIGDEPVLRYAELLGEALGGAAGERLHGSVARFLAGDRDDELLEEVDGYNAAWALAERSGLSRAQIGAAFERSRDDIHAGIVPTRIPPDFRDFLDRMRERVGVVLVTNAPHRGVDAILELTGLTGSLDHAVGDAGKPHRMPEIARGVLADAGLPGRFDRLCSVGDIWRNDLAPIRELGGRTALIDRWGRGGGEPDWRVAQFAELYDTLLVWAGVPGARL